MPTKRSTIAAAAGLASLALLLSGCDALGQAPWEETPVTTDTSTAAPIPTATCNDLGFESVFSAFGTVHYTRVLAPDLTLYLDLYTEQKVHEWYPSTPEKKLSYVLEVIDSAAAERDPFKMKRKTYMSEFRVEANTVTAGGTPGTSVFLEDLDPLEATRDPEALNSKRYGLLITAPKGGFQREDKTTLGVMSDDTIGVNMDFQLTISAQQAVGSKSYDTQLYTIQLPIAIFNDVTKDKSSSCATNATLSPVAG